MENKFVEKIMKNTGSNKNPPTHPPNFTDVQDEMNGKKEKDSIQERVLAILTANKYCQESPPKEAHTHENLANLEVSPIAERKDEKRQRVRNRQPNQNKQRLFAIEEMTPEELEMDQKIKEYKQKRNLYERNRYNSLTLEQRREIYLRKAAARRQRAMENSLKEADEDDANNAQYAEPLEFARDPEVLTVLETVPEAAEISPLGFHGNMEIEESLTPTGSVIDYSGNNIEKPRKPRELTEVQKMKQREKSKRKYHQMPEDKKRAMIKRGVENKRKKRQKIREEKAKNAELMSTNTIEPLDEANLKMLLDIIQSLGPADQGKVEAE